jgi:hypothetical protein
MLLAPLLSVLAFSAHQPVSKLTCEDVPNLETVLERGELTYLLIGEYHGTVEMPAIAAEAACVAAAAGRRIVFGIEFSPANQPALDAYMRSDGAAEARQRLLAAPAWREEGGRTTLAILHLLERIRQIGRFHAVSVIAFDAAPEPGTSVKREAAMAESLMKAARSAPDTIVIALTGSGHADKEGWTSRTPPFPAAAGHLPADQTISLTFARPGGNFWGCQSPEGDRSRGCSSYQMPPREPVSPRGITLDPSLRSGFDGVYSVGKQYSASRPASSE